VQEYFVFLANYIIKVFICAFNKLKKSSCASCGSTNLIERFFEKHIVCNDFGHKWKVIQVGHDDGQYLRIIPEHNLVPIFNRWNIFDISRATKEYLSSRVLKALAS
jgi:hypothetical protein